MSSNLQVLDRLAAITRQAPPGTSVAELRAKIVATDDAALVRAFDGVKSTFDAAKQHLPDDTAGTPELLVVIETMVALAARQASIEQVLGVETVPQLRMKLLHDGYPHVRMEAAFKATDHREVLVTIENQTRSASFISKARYNLGFELEGTEYIYWYDGDADTADSLAKGLREQLLKTGKYDVVYDPVRSKDTWRHPARPGASYATLHIIERAPLDAVKARGQPT